MYEIFQEASAALRSVIKMERNTAVLVILICFQVLVVVFLWEFDVFRVRGRELDCFGSNRACKYPFVAKSWNLSMVTRYAPYVPARCNSLWSGKRREVKKVRSRLVTWRNSRSDEVFLKQLHNCTYVQELLNDNFYNSPVERQFPLAFLMVIHNHPQQVVRLLRVLYRPQNVYCIHVDAKAKKELIEAIENLSRCVPNILVSAKLVEVYWCGAESYLEAQLSCLELLHAARETWKWRYVMNTCGTELPLKTNREMVEHLRKMNGTTYMFTSDFPKTLKKERFTYKHLPDGQPQQTNETFGEPPYGIKLYKSSTYCIMSYAFADFVLTHPKAIALRKYLKGALIAEEHFYITLYHLLEAPVGEAPIHLISSISIWFKSYAEIEMCNAAAQHNLCIAGVGTMQSIHGRAEFFFNKYHEEVDHVIMDCIEKLIVQRNILEYSNDSLNETNVARQYLQVL